MSLTINIATRGRPQLMLETVCVLISKLERSDTVLVISVDDDDAQTRDILPCLPSDQRIVADVSPREDSMGAKWNRALKYPADLYLPLADYCLISTPAFDQKIIDAALFPDGIGCVYGPLCNASFPAVQAVTHGLVQKMGFMFPPYFPYWFHDHWVDDVLRMIDRISFVDIGSDATSRKPGTAEMREPRFWATVFDMGRLVRRQCALDIINSPDFIEAPWRKEVLRHHFPLIEFRSRWINDCVRDMAPRIEAEKNPGPGGERYDRARADALKLVSQWLPDVRESVGLAA